MIFSRPFINYHKGLSEKKRTLLVGRQNIDQRLATQRKKSNATGRKEYLPPSFLFISTMKTQKRITFFSLFSIIFVMRIY